MDYLSDQVFLEANIFDEENDIEKYIEDENIEHKILKETMEEMVVKEKDCCIMDRVSYYRLLLNPDEKENIYTCSDKNCCPKELKCCYYCYKKIKNHDLGENFEKNEVYLKTFLCECSQNLHDLHLDYKKEKAKIIVESEKIEDHLEFIKNNNNNFKDIFLKKEPEVILDYFFKSIEVLGKFAKKLSYVENYIFQDDERVTLDLIIKLVCIYPDIFLKGNENYFENYENILDLVQNNEKLNQYNDNKSFILILYFKIRIVRKVVLYPAILQTMNILQLRGMENSNFLHRHLILNTADSMYNSLVEKNAYFKNKDKKVFQKISLGLIDFLERNNFKDQLLELFVEFKEWFSIAIMFNSRISSNEASETYKYYSEILTKLSTFRQKLGIHLNIQSQFKSMILFIHRNLIESDENVKKCCVQLYCDVFKCCISFKEVNDNKFSISLLFSKESYLTNLIESIKSDGHIKNITSIKDVKEKINNLKVHTTSDRASRLCFMRMRFNNSIINNLKEFFSNKISIETFLNEIWMTLKQALLLFEYEKTFCTNEEEFFLISLFFFNSGMFNVLYDFQYILHNLKALFQSKYYDIIKKINELYISVCNGNIFFMEIVNTDKYLYLPNIYFNNNIVDFDFFIDIYYDFIKTIKVKRYPLTFVSALSDPYFMTIFTKDALNYNLKIKCLKLFKLILQNCSYFDYCSSLYIIIDYLSKYCTNSHFITKRDEFLGSLESDKEYKYQHFELFYSEIISLISIFPVEIYTQGITGILTSKQINKIISNIEDKRQDIEEIINFSIFHMRSISQSITSCHYDFNKNYADLQFYENYAGNKGVKVEKKNHTEKCIFNEENKDKYIFSKNIIELDQITDDFMFIQRRINDYPKYYEDFNKIEEKMKIEGFRIKNNEIPSELDSKTPFINSFLKKCDRYFTTLELKQKYALEVIIKGTYSCIMMCLMYSSGRNSRLEYIIYRLVENLYMFFYYLTQNEDLGICDMHHVTSILQDNQNCDTNKILSKFFEAISTDNQLRQHFLPKNNENQNFHLSQVFKNFNDGVKECVKEATNFFYNSTNCSLFINKVAERLFYLDCKVEKFTSCFKDTKDFQIFLYYFKANPTFMQNLLLDFWQNDLSAIIIYYYRILRYLMSFDILDFEIENPKSLSVNSILSILEFFRLLCENHNRGFQYILVILNDGNMSFIELIIAYLINLDNIYQHFERKKDEYTCAKDFLFLDRNINQINILVEKIIDVLIEIIQGAYSETYEKLKAIMTNQICDLAYFTNIIFFKISTMKQNSNYHDKLLKNLLRFWIAFLEDTNNDTDIQLWFLNKLKENIIFQVILHYYIMFLKEIEVKENDINSANEAYERYMDDNNQYKIDKNENFIMIGYLSLFVRYCDQIYEYYNLRNFEHFINLEIAISKKELMEVSTQCKKFIKRLVLEVEINFINNIDYSSETIKRFDNLIDSLKLKESSIKDLEEINISEGKIIKIFYLIRKECTLIDDNEIIYFHHVIATLNEYKIRRLEFLEFVVGLKNNIEQTKAMRNMLKNSKLLTYADTINQTNVFSYLSVSITIIVNIMNMLSSEIQNENTFINHEVILSKLLSLINLFIMFMVVSLWIYKVKNFWEIISKKKEIEQLEKKKRLEIAYEYIKYFLIQHNMTTIIFNFVVGIFAIFLQIFCSLQLFSIVLIFPTMRAVFSSLKLRYEQFFSAALLIFATVWVYSFICYFYFKESFYNADLNENLCETPFKCFFSLITFGIRAGNGLGFSIKSITDNRYWIEFMFDWSFFLVLILILVNLFNGIVVDTFQNLRATNATKNDKIKNECFICGLTATQLETKGVNFELHVNKDHLIRSYISYLLKILYTNKEELNAIESNVADQIEKNDTTFIPSGKYVELTKATTQEKSEKIEEQKIPEAAVETKDLLTTL